MADAAAQNSWRWRNNDGTEINATWAAAENTAITGLDKNVTKRLRFGVANNAGDNEFQEKAAVGGVPGQDNPTAAVIDSTGGFAYFGTYTVPGRILKIRLSDFTVVSSLTMDSGEGYLYSAFIDSVGENIYFGTSTSPGLIVKINLSSFTKVATLALASGENNLHSAVVSGNYAYFGTDSSPGKVVKIDLTNFTRTGALNLASGEDWLYAALVSGNYAYFGTYTYPGKVVKIDLTNFTRLGALDFAEGEDGIASAVVSDGYAYFGTDTSPGKVVKIDLTSFTRLGALDLASGEDSVYTALVSGNYAYFGTYASPGKVVKIDLTNFTRTGVLVLAGGEEWLFAAAASGGYAYFGTWNAPGRIIKVKLSDFTKESTLTLTVGDTYFSSSVIDTVNGYVYFGTYTAPARIAKFRLSDFSYVGSITLSSGENNLRAAVIDTISGYAYFSTYSGISGDASIIIKVNLATFTRVGAITMTGGGGNFQSAVLDAANGYALFGGGNWPDKIARIRLSDFTEVGTLTLNGGEGNCRTATVDAVHGYAYFGTGTFPGIVVKIRLSDFTRISAVSLQSGEDNLTAAATDSAGGYAYFGTWTWPSSIVVKIKLSDFTRVGAITMPSGEYYPRSAAIDEAGGYLYLSLQNFIGSTVRIRLSDFVRIDSVPTPAEISSPTYPSAIDVSNGYLYVGTSESPAYIVKISIRPHPDLRLEYAVKTGGSCAASTGWTAVATGAAIQPASSSYLTDGAATTNVAAGLTDGGATFSPGQAKDVSAEAGDILLDTDKFTEVEYSLKAGPSAADGAAYCFRLTDAGSPLAAYSGYAEATLASSYAPVTAAASTSSRLSAGSSGTFSMSFTLPSAQSTQFILTFPSGFTVNSAFTSGTCAGGGTISNFQVGANGTTITADKSACAGTVTLSGAVITNPSVAGIYIATFVNDSPGEVVIPVTDSDAVSVMGNVDPTLTFDLDVSVADGDSAAPYAVDLGGLASAAPRGSGSPGTIPSIWLDLETNATSGALVTVRSANAALKSVSAPSDAIASATGLLAPNDEGYGLCAASLSGTLRTEIPALAFTAQAPYDASGSCLAGTWSVGALQTADQNLLAATGPLDNGRAQLRVAASAANSTPAHPDYQDVLTFLATATY